MKKPLVSPHRAAFSLIELVVVIAIIAIIATFTVPAATTILKGSAMTQASQTLTDQLSFARQRALSRNLAVEVRFYQYCDTETPGETDKDGNPLPPGSGQYRGMQLFEVVESGAAVPIDKPQRLPVSVVMEPNATFSTLIGSRTSVTSSDVKKDNTAPLLPRGVGNNYNYTAFRFQQDGSTNLPPASTWFITIRNLTDKVTGTKPPANFFTLQVDPVSGAVKGFRPTAG